VRRQLDLVAVPVLAPVAAGVSGEELDGVLGGLAQCGDGPGGDGDLAQREARSLRLTAEGEDRPSLLKEMLVRTPRAEGGDQLGAGERPGRLDLDRCAARRTSSFGCRHWVLFLHDTRPYQKATAACNVGPWVPSRERTSCFPGSCRSRVRRLV